MRKIDDSLSFYDDVAGLERYLNLPVGSLRNIPIYARKPAVDAIIKVQELERSSLFRPGLYYIVLSDLCGNTAFNAKYGNHEADIRTEWFHTAVIESIGEIDLSNYVAFSKTLGDGSLMIFSSFIDVFAWSERLSQNLEALSQEYAETLTDRFAQLSDEQFKEQLSDFQLRARRLVHLGEVSYKDHADPLSLAVSQTFKIEKTFSETHLGCTQAVADAVRPKLQELGLQLHDNTEVTLPGLGRSMTYYIKKVLPEMPLGVPVH